MIDLHMKADSHAPFAHYMVTIPPQVVEVKNRETRVITQEIREGSFVICYFCGHWVERLLTKRCDCPASCHTAFDQEE